MLDELFKFFAENHILDVATGFVITVVVFGIAASFVSVFSSSVKTITTPIPVSYKIAVIGLPGAGKTTLITALFELIQRGIHVDRVRLHGVDTINTINKYIARLSGHNSMGPTKEKDIFVFRFSYIKRIGFLRRLFDVEIADFPGEYSAWISSQTGTPTSAFATTTSASFADHDADAERRIPQIVNQESRHGAQDLEHTLFNREFFSWIGSARDYLFLVDFTAVRQLV
jgi:hypothetical protein